MNDTPASHGSLFYDGYLWTQILRYGWSGFSRFTM